MTSDPNHLPSDVIAHLWNGDKPAAIRRLCECEELELATAKEQVENYIARIPGLSEHYRQQHNEIYRGCLAVSIGMAIALALVTYIFLRL